MNYLRLIGVAAGTLFGVAISMLFFGHTDKVHIFTFMDEGFGMFMLILNYFVLDKIGFWSKS